MIEKYGAEIDVDEDDAKQHGVVTISSAEQEKIDAAKNAITNMFRTVEIGEEFDGVVTRVEAYGAFVEYLSGREGLVHVSNMSTEFVQDASQMVNVGDAVHVRLSEIKEDGKIGLSMLSAEQEAEARANRPARAPFRGGDRGGDSFGGGRRFDDNNGPVRTPEGGSNQAESRPQESGPSDSGENQEQKRDYIVIRKRLGNQPLFVGSELG